MQKAKGVVGFFLVGMASFSTQLFGQIPLTLIERTPTSVVEVIIPKVEDSKILYEQELPRQKIPFKQRMDKYFSIGTAFFVSPTQLVSAAHVFELHERRMNNDFFVRTMEGKVFPVQTVTKYSQYRDVIEFTLSAYPTKVTPLNLRENYKIGESVCAPGNAIGEGISLRCGGQITSTNPEALSGKWENIRFSTPVSPGNSGGPLMDEKGDVLGVVVRKSMAENLNVALPISEYINLGKENAEFSMPDLRIRESTGPSTKGDWSFTTPLPARPTLINHLAYTALNKFYLALIGKHQTTYKGRLFPDNDMFRVYLKAQSADNSYFAVVTTKDKNQMNWGMDSGNLKTMRIGVDQELNVQTIQRRFFFTLEKPKDRELTAFFEDPKYILDTVTRNLGFTRTIGDEEIKITSYGPPEKVTDFTDKLGRPWKMSVWFTHYNFSYIAMYCSPTPKGAACYKNWGEIAEFTAYQDKLEKESLDEALFSYYGSLEEWRHFLELDDKYRASAIRTVKIETGGKAFTGSFEKIGFTFKAAGEKKKDMLEVRVGYSPFERLKMTILSINYNPRIGISEGFSLEKIYAPDEFLSPQYRGRIERIFNAEPPYDGKPYQIGNNHVVQKLLNKFDGEQAIQVTCYVPMHVDSGKAVGYCENLQ